MTEAAGEHSFAAIIVAAGSGLRAGGDLPKQFQPWRGKPMLCHSVEAMARAGASPIILVTAVDHMEAAKQLLGDTAIMTAGGETRQLSVINGLDALSQAGGAHYVLIHDAARPDLPQAVIKRLLQSLESHDGAIPVLPVVDSMALGADGRMSGTADRTQLWRIQTPQAFDFVKILAAHRTWGSVADATDDSSVAIHAGMKVALVEGDEALKKITFAKDLEQMDHPPAFPRVRTGMGFDVHRLSDGEELWLGGIKIDHHQGLAGHSDADVALHAITDAVLGTLALGDIGDHFPPSDPQWRGASSDRFLAHAVSLKGSAHISHVDLTIICEAPRIGGHKAAMQQRIAAIMGIDSSAVSVKATTTEKLGFAGRGEGIAAQAVVTIIGD